LPSALHRWTPRSGLVALRSINRSIGARLGVTWVFLTSFSEDLNSSGANGPGKSVLQPISELSPASALTSALIVSYELCTLVSPFCFHCEFSLHLCCELCLHMYLGLALAMRTRARRDTVLSRGCLVIFVVIFALIVVPLTIIHCPHVLRTPFRGDRVRSRI